MWAVEYLKKRFFLEPLVIDKKNIKTIRIRLSNGRYKELCAQRGNEDMLASIKANQDLLCNRNISVEKSHDLTEQNAKDAKYMKYVKKEQKEQNTQEYDGYAFMFESSEHASAFAAEAAVASLKATFVKTEAENAIKVGECAVVIHAHSSVLTKASTPLLGV